MSLFVGAMWDRVNAFVVKSGGTDLQDKHPARAKALSNDTVVYKPRTSFSCSVSSAALVPRWISL